MNQFDGVEAMAYRTKAEAESAAIAWATEQQRVLAIRPTTAYEQDQGDLGESAFWLVFTSDYELVDDLDRLTTIVGPRPDGLWRLYNDGPEGWKKERVTTHLT